MANACSLFQDGGPHENDCTTSGNDATAITGDDAIFCDRFSHFLSLYLRLLVFHQVSLFNVNHVLYSAGWFESLISPKHPRRFSCYTAVIVVEILYT